MRFDTLPPEFGALAKEVSYVQRVNSSEWSSSCPKCGGEPHKGGDLPDRFRMWTNANGKNKIMGWCRRCSYVWFPTNDIPMNKDDFEKWRKEQIIIETRKKEEAEKAIELLQSQKIWEHYNAELNDWAYEVLGSWGIDKPMAEFWKLGLIKDYLVKPEQYHSPAISIPVWDFDGRVENVKVRVLNPRSSSDRYRSLYKTGRDALFVARYDIKDKEEVLVVEGEKKAMVSAMQLVNKQVVGLPSVTPSLSVVKQLDGFKKVIICLDPDARKANGGVSPLRRLIDLVGRERVRLFNLSYKIDDEIVDFKLPLAYALRYNTQKVK